MKKNLLLPLFILVFSAAAFAQSDLPQIGKIDDIKGKTKFYIVADALNSKQILNVIDKKKTLIRVEKPEDAEFFIEYKTLFQQTVTSMQMLMETGELNAYFYGTDKRKVIAWSESSTTALAWPSAKLAQKFQKAMGIK